MESALNLKVGQLVSSKAGRDSGKQFIVYEIVNDKYVKLVDGDLRKVENPKLKKIKHISKTNGFSSFIFQKIDTNQKITNKMIRNELEKLKESYFVKSEV